MNQNQDYRGTELYSLLYSTFPRLRRIEDVLSRTDPAVVSELIRNEAESVFVLDYYFRLFKEDIGGRIINDEGLEISGLVELFHCRAVQFYSDNQDQDKPDFNWNKKNDAYWSRLNETRRRKLFSSIPEGAEYILPAALLLRDMGSEALMRIMGEQENRVLKIFRHQDLSDLFVLNPDLYDFVYRAAVRVGDSVLSKSMSGHLNATVKVRLARMYSAELNESVGASGKVPMETLLHLARMLPEDSLDYILLDLRRQGILETAAAEELARINRRLARDTAASSSAG